MTTEEMKREIIHLQTLAEDVPRLIKMRDKLLDNKERQTIYNALAELLGGYPVAKIEIARWYRDHAKDYDSGMTESINWYCDFLANPTHEEEYPQYWGEAKEIVNEFHSGYIK